MSTDAKILIRLLSDRSEVYSVVVSDEDDNRVEIDCKSQAAAETLVGVLVVTGSDVEIKPTESINEFARLHQDNAVGKGCVAQKLLHDIRSDIGVDEPPEPEGNGEKPEPA